MTSLFKEAMATTMKSSEGVSHTFIRIRGLRIRQLIISVIATIYHVLIDEQKPVGVGLVNFDCALIASRKNILVKISFRKPHVFSRRTTSALPSIVFFQSRHQHNSAFGWWRKGVLQDWEELSMLLSSPDQSFEHHFAWADAENTVGHLSRTSLPPFFSPIVCIASSSPASS